MTPEIESALEKALEVCAAEPIHQLGFIQAHGVALVLNPAADFEIIQVSENIATLLNLSIDQVLNKSLSSVLGDEATKKVAQLIAKAHHSAANYAIGVIDLTSRYSHKLDAHVFISDGFPVVELSDDANIDKPDDIAELFLEIQKLLEEAESETHLHPYLDKAAHIVRLVMGYDNVMVYRFDESWDGQVIAQSRCEVAPDFLGLHFPASDIPPQARALYTKNKVRVLTDVDADSVAFVPAYNPLSQQPLDLTFSSLRSLSAIHLSYLRNMGTSATMTISLLKNGNLWGIIACHHLTPKRIPVLMRHSAHLISKMVASKLEMYELTEQQGYANKYIDFNALVVSLFSTKINKVSNEVLQTLMSVIESTGIIVVVNGELFMEGIILQDADIVALLAWLNDHAPTGHFVCNELSSKFELAESYQNKVSGLLAICPKNMQQDCIIWLRAEKLKTVNWAGSYVQGLSQTAEGHYQLSPRNSFKTWAQTWQGISEPWTEDEVKLAGLFNKSIADFQQSVLLQNQLVDFQQSHEDIVNLIPDTIIITDPQRRVTFVNKDFEMATGYSQQEALGKNLAFLQGPDTDQVQIELIRSTLNEGKSFKGEILNYTKAGKAFWNELTISPIFDRKNQLTQFVGIQRDVTQKKLQLDAIALSEKRFRELSNTAPTLIWQADIYNNRYWFNMGWLAFRGRRLQDEQGCGWMQGVHPDDLKLALKTYYKAFDQRSDFRLEYRLQRYDGEYRWIDGRGVPQFTEEGEFEGYIGTCTDVTNIRNSKAATDFFNSTIEMIYCTDLNGIILDCNERFFELTGYEKDQVIGLHVRLLKSGLHDKEFYAHMWQQIFKQGHWRGELINRHKLGHITTQMTSISTVYDDQGRPKRYLAVASDIAMIIEKRQQLEQLAYYDNLTGLANRSLLTDRLTRAMSRVKRRGGFIAVVFIDLDGFKIINDHYGHDVGDEFLVAISQQMQSGLREHDTLARLGGDEFVVILDELKSINNIEGVVSTLLNACRSAFMIRNLELKVSASIGIYLYPSDPEGYDIDAEILISRADQAMYVAKRQGKNNFHFFDQAQDQIVVTRNNAIKEIELGLSRNEFELYYQPKVNMRTGKVLGFEALIRWNKNNTELFSPHVFLPVVQNIPLGIKLGNWVIKTALTQLAEWHKQGFDFILSVNVDARQLMQSNFVENLEAEINTISTYQMGSFALEILETTKIDDRLKVIEIINCCRGLGVEFYLDDFGTGYSSITYLKELPFKTLKIDRSFIQGICQSNQGLQLVINLIRLASDMGKQVLAEGVETIEQGVFLIKLGCEVAQGYAIAKPMPVDKVLSWLSDWQPFSEWQAAINNVPNYHLLFEQMSDPVVITQQGRFIDCNTAASKFLGYADKDGLINKLVIDISPEFQPDGSLSVDSVKANIEQVQKNGFSRVEWVFLKADGSEVFVEVMMTAMTLNGSHVLYSVWRELKLPD